MRRISLAAFDIDGTLFDERKKTFPASAICALKKLNERKISIALVTGRPPASASLIESFGVGIDAYVCCNGHMVIHQQNVLYDERFSSVLAEEVWKYCQEHDIGLMWKYPDKTIVYKDDEEFQKIFAKNSKYRFNRFNIIYDRQDYHWIEAANNGVLACSIEELEEFNRVFDKRCVAIDINGKSSDLMLYGISKQSGFEKLLKQLNLLPEECIAFGDNNNDLEMLKYAGIGVCMGNGSAKLKEMADYVAADIADDGIYKALEHFELI